MWYKTLAPLLNKNNCKNRLLVFDWRGRIKNGSAYISISLCCTKLNTLNEIKLYTFLRISNYFESNQKPNYVSVSNEGDPEYLSMYNDSLQGVGPGDRTMVVAVLYGNVHYCHLGPHSILYNGYRAFLGVKAAGIYNFLINCRTENFPFNILHVLRQPVFHSSVHNSCVLSTLLDSTN